MNFLKEHWVILYGAVMWSLGNLSMYIRLKRKKIVKEWDEINDKRNNK